METLTLVLDVSVSGWCVSWAGPLACAGCIPAPLPVRAGIDSLPKVALNAHKRRKIDG